MTWVVWRMHRTPLIVAAVALAAFAVLLLITGLQMASQYHNALQGCAATKSCGDLINTLNLGSNPATIIVNLSIAVPALLGLFWGAPTVAREIEAGTSQFAWVQSVTRVRWLAVKTGWLVIAAIVWGGAVAALVTWWSGPQNAVSLDRFNPNVFDGQDIVPVAYSLFAVALGIAAGTIVRRTAARAGDHARCLRRGPARDRGPHPAALPARADPDAENRRHRGPQGRLLAAHHRYRQRRRGQRAADGQRLHRAGQCLPARLGRPRRLPALHQHRAASEYGVLPQRAGTPPVPDLPARQPLLAVPSSSRAESSSYSPPY